MRDEIVKRNLIIIISSLLVFFLSIELVTNYFNRKEMEEELLNISTIVENKIGVESLEKEMKNTVDSFTIDQDWLRITVARIDGQIIKDSSDDSIGVELERFLSDEEIRKATTYDIAKNKISLKNETLTYINEMKNGYILTCSMAYVVNSSYILLSIFIMSIVLISSILLTVLLSRKLSNKFIGAIQEVSMHLRTINEGKYSEIELGSTYQELDPFIDEINTINENITESIERIKNEKDKINFIINNIFQGIIINDEDENVLIINDRARELLDLHPISSERHKCQKYLRDEELVSTIRKSISTRGEYRFDRTVTDTGRTYQFTISYLKNKWNERSREVGLIITAISDVTEDRMNDKVKRDFISNASHELKTPVTSIRGFAELLELDDTLSEKTRRHVEIILSESVKMKETIDSLMYLSSLDKLEKNNDEVKEKIYLGELVDECIEEYSDIAFKKGVKFTKECDDSYIFEGRTLVYHLVSNLIDNAIKYNKTNGFVIIRVREEESSITLSVSDTGIGIEEKNIGRLFERFYRVDKSHNSEIKGTGLGLNIVKEICEKIDAKVDVKSQFGIGTTFTLTFNKGEQQS